MRFIICYHYGKDGTEEDMYDCDRDTFEEAEAEAEHAGKHMSAEDYDTGDYYFARLDREEARNAIRTASADEGDGLRVGRILGRAAYVPDARLNAIIEGNPTGYLRVLSLVNLTFRRPSGARIHGGVLRIEGEHGTVSLLPDGKRWAYGDSTFDSAAKRV